MTEHEIPSALTGWELNLGERQVENELGAKLANVFSVSYAEVRCGRLEARLETRSQILAVMRALTLQILQAQG